MHGYFPPSFAILMSKNIDGNIVNDIDEEPRNHFTLFASKALTSLASAIILGHYIDALVERFRREGRFGTHIGVYIALQLLLTVVAMYVLQHGFTNIVTHRCLFSAVLFAMQTRLIVNVRYLLGAI